MIILDTIELNLISNLKLKKLLDNKKCRSYSMFKLLYRDIVKYNNQDKYTTIELLLCMVLLKKEKPCFWFKNRKLKELSVRLLSIINDRISATYETLTSEERYHYILFFHISSVNSISEFGSSLIRNLYKNLCLICLDEIIKFDTIDQIEIDFISRFVIGDVEHLSNDILNYQFLKENYKSNDLDFIIFNLNPKKIFFKEGIPYDFTYAPYSNIIPYHYLNPYPQHYLNSMVLQFLEHKIFHQYYDIYQECLNYKYELKFNKILELYDSLKGE